MYVLEDCVRQNLEERSFRVLGVLHPLKVVIENFQEDQVEELEARFHPTNEKMGTRILPFTREIYIDRNDFVRCHLPNISASPMAKKCDFVMDT